MTTRDDARRTASEPRTDGLRLVPPRPEPSRGDPDRLPDRDRGTDGSGGPERDGDRSSGGGRGSALAQRLYAARGWEGVRLYQPGRVTNIRARYLGDLAQGDSRGVLRHVHPESLLSNYA